MIASLRQLLAAILSISIATPVVKASCALDAVGNRASKTVNGVTTTYLVDTQNPTGYAHVLLESFGGRSGTAYEITHTYVYGLERISERRNFLQNNQGNFANVYYVYDGHGSVRALTDATGTVTDTYDYDAFGNLLHQTGTTPNNYLYSGEQFDPDLGLHYNRRVPREPKASRDVLSNPKLLPNSAVSL